MNRKGGRGKLGDSGSEIQGAQRYYKLIRGIVLLREYSFNVYNTPCYNKRIHGYGEFTSPFGKVAPRHYWL